MAPLGIQFNVSTYLSCTQKNQLEMTLIALVDRVFGLSQDAFLGTGDDVMSDFSTNHVTNYFTGIRGLELGE